MNELTYMMIGTCNNCGADSQHEFPKGTEVHPQVCPNCGCSVTAFRRPDRW